MLRFRITTQASPDEEEQTWVLLPDLPSAQTQAEEYHSRTPAVAVRVYREETGKPAELVLHLTPRNAGRRPPR